MFAVQVLIRVDSEIPGRAAAHLHQILGACDQWSGENRWKVVGTNLGPWHVGADSVWRRANFDRRLDRGEFAPRKESLVTTAEIAGFLKPPTRRCGLPNVVRSGGMVPPAPKELPTWTIERAASVLLQGWVPTPDGRERLIGTPLHETLFTVAIGKSGYGKTERALAQAASLAHAGEGLWFLDPHGDAWQRIRPYLAHPHIGEKLWAIDLTTRSVSDKQTGWNPLSMTGRRREDIQEVVSVVVTGIAAANSWGDQANRAQTILTKACETLCHLGLLLPADAQPTLFQIRTLLDDEDWRMAVAPFLPRDLRRYWTTTFTRLAADAVPVVTSIVDRLSSSVSLKAFLGQPRSTYDARRAMDDGRIVFLCPAGTGSTDRLVSCLLIYDLFRAGMSRRDIPVQDRRPFHAFIDELTAIDGAAKGTVAAIVEQLRKFGLRGHFMTQMAQRLSRTTRDAILQNASVLSTTAGEADTVKVMGKQWASQVEVETLVNLDRYHHVMSATLNGHMTSPFKVRGVEVTDLFADLHRPDSVDRLEQAVDTNLRRRQIADILDEVENLDDVILANLSGGSPPSGPSHPPSRARPRRGSGHYVDVSGHAPETPHQTGAPAANDDDGVVVPLRPTTDLE